MTLLDAQLAARLDKTTEEVAGMTWDELLRAETTSSARSTS
jgi:hypothetical protein